jgi:hypothetical protein
MLVREPLLNRIVTYISGSNDTPVQNTGVLNIPLLDERFIAEDFNKIMPIKFKTLQGAVSAENNILEKLQKIQETGGVPSFGPTFGFGGGGIGSTQNGVIMPDGTFLPSLPTVDENGLPLDTAGAAAKLGLTPEQLIQNAKDSFLLSLGNLVNQQDDSIVALKSRVANLESQLENKDSIISDQLQSISNFDNVLSAVSFERDLAVAKADALESSNLALLKEYDDTLLAVEARVQDQLSAIQTMVQSNTPTT